ncbi:hypothetical protein G7054_g10922 [Neopestalotiopsis clavispora]|nr:hypothetical protein G7054_g10922 [Neopestalotiopsis clavispora]
MSSDGHRTSGYAQPPKDILDVLQAPTPAVPVLSPTIDRMIMVQWEKHPPIERLAAPFLRLAGVRVEPHNHSRRDNVRGSGFAPSAYRYDLVQVPDGKRTRIELPFDNARLGSPIWSANGQFFAFRNITDKAVELWIGDGNTGAVKQVPNVRLNSMLGDTLQWMPDQKTLLVKLVAPNLSAPPSKPLTLSGPEILEANGEKGQSSTYETRDTLKDAHDEDLFDYYAAAQLAFVDASTLETRYVGDVDRFLSLDPSTDGNYLLVQTIQRPYSHITTHTRFPRNIEIWSNLNDQSVSKKTIASLPLAERVPIKGVRTGPRLFSWRANAPATLIWAEALDGGDWHVSVPARDKIMLLEAPFDAAPREITRTEYRFEHIRWGERADMAILSEYDINKKWNRSYIFNIDEPDNRKLLWDFSMQERYDHPGTPVHRKLPNGAVVMRQEGDSIFLSGNGSSPDGDRPFLDRLDLKSLKTERLFRSSRSDYEYFVDFDKSDTKTFLTRRQSPDDPPNIFRRSLSGQIDAEEREATWESESLAITHDVDPTPAVRQIKKRLVRYKRDDGLELSFKLYTPPGYKEGTRLPAILYAYPRDYADGSTAGQIVGSLNQFTSLAKYSYLLLAGYAIIDRVSFPIIGDPKRAYDTYLKQLVANAQAAVDEAVRLGVVDRHRIGVTGHSHGALMTANLITHSSLFRAGVATSGSYNKTFTPFGFQSERRSLWEAHEVYYQASPFLAADKIKEPLLLMHGADDANPGTKLFQSEMLYAAIRGNGGVSRLVVLPHEPHAYSAQETNEHVVHEMLTWFDKYVKNREDPPSGEVSEKSAL